MINVENDCRLAFRKFNRFYTDVLGFLNEHIYDSPFSLTETRILFEIYNTFGCMAKDIQQNLNLDGGYVSRIIKKFEKEKMIYKQKSKEDARNHYLFVTKHGEIIYKELEKKANQQVDNILENLGQEQQQKLVASMNTIQDILFSSLKRTEESISVRSYYTSEDLKNMIEHQWEFYNRVHNWDESFLAYLHETFEAEIERIWIAEINGQFAGSIGLVNAAEKVGQLRWFFVNPSFQNKGLGTQLIKSLIQYCKHFNYERIFLWTVSDMETARTLYKKMGFEITEEKAEVFMWGTQLIEERWDLELGSK